MIPDPTPIERVEERALGNDGNVDREFHPSFGMAMFNRVQGTSHQLFDSDVSHRQFVTLRIHTASRRRDLKTDWIHAEEELIEVHMSHAQFGALVSSFGGRAVPVTINHRDGAIVPRPVDDVPRLQITAAEVREAAVDSVDEVRKAWEQLNSALSEKPPKMGKIRAAAREIEIRVNNLPANMKFAADRLTEHTEDVVTKAKADIEAMAINAVEHGVELAAGDLPVIEIEAGEA